MRAMFILLNATLLGLVSVPAAAHHSFSAFDKAKTLEISGTVKEVQYTNPHAWLFVTVMNAQRQAETWAIEAGGPNILRRQGWKANTLKAGDKVTVRMNPMRDATKKGGSLLAVKLPDGRTIGTWQ